MIDLTDEFVEVHRDLSSRWLMPLLANDPPQLPVGVNESDPRVQDLIRRAKTKMQEGR